MNLQGGTAESAVSDQHQTVDHLVDSYAPPTPPATSDGQEPQGAVEGLGALVDVNLNNVNSLGDGYCESTDQSEEVNEPRPPYLQDNFCKSLEVDTKRGTQQDFRSLEESGGNRYELVKDSGATDCESQASEIQDASLTNESLIGPNLTAEVLSESEIYARSDQYYEAEENLCEDTRVKFLPERKKNHDVVADLCEYGQFEVDRRIGTEESEKESVHEPYYNCGNVNNVPVLSVSDSICAVERKQCHQHIDDIMKPFEPHPSPCISDTSNLAIGIVKPETDPGAEVLFDDIGEKLIPEPNVSQIAIAKLCEDVYVEVDHGFWTEESGIKSEPSFPESGINDCFLERKESYQNVDDSKKLVELLPSFSLSDTPILASSCVKAETGFAEIPNSVSGQAPECVKVDDFSWNDSLMGYSYVQHTPGTELVHDIVYSEEETKTFHTGDVDTKDEDFVVIIENVDIPTEIAGRKLDFQQEISSGIGSSNASSVDVLLSEGKLKGIKERA